MTAWGLEEHTDYDLDGWTEGRHKERMAKHGLVSKNVALSMTCNSYMEKGI